MPDCLEEDVTSIRRAGLTVTKGDIICMTLGHLSRLAIQSLASSWNRELPIEERLEQARAALDALIEEYNPQGLAEEHEVPRSLDEAVDERNVIQYALPF